MAVTLTHTGRTPGQSQFGLDNFTESYKTNSLATDVLTDGSVPQKGDAHPDFPFMFVTDRHVTETGPSASALDLVYQGVMIDDGHGNPILPFPQFSQPNQVMSATSSKLNTGAALLSPATLQYYAPSNQKSFITYLTKATSDQYVDDPTDDITPITLTVSDTTYNPTSLQAAISALYTKLVIHTLDPQEIVSGQYWLNISKKVVTMSPWIFNFTPGEYIVMYAPGQGYTVGNTLTINDGMGHSASINVDSVGIGNSVVGFTASSNTFDYTTPSPLTASGGSGSGAAFYNYHIA